METQTPDSAGTRRLRTIFWLSAALTAFSIVFDVLDPPINWLRLAARVPLLVVLVMLATVRPPVTRARKMLMWALIGLAIGLLVAGLVRPV